MGDGAGCPPVAGGGGGGLHEPVPYGVGVGIWDSVQGSVTVVQPSVQFIGITCTVELLGALIDG